MNNLNYLGSLELVELPMPTAMVAFKPAGRPKGSTVACKESLETRKRKAADEASSEYLEFKKRGKCRKGTMDAIIASTVAKYVQHGDKDFAISKELVKTRARRESTVVAHRGPETPMIDVEPMLVQFFIQRARMGQPLKQREGLAFANSIIDGTAYQTKVSDFQKKTSRWQVGINTWDGLDHHTGGTSYGETRRR